MTNNYTPSTSCYSQYPMRLFKADLYCRSTNRFTRCIYNESGDWGEATTVEEVSSRVDPMPDMLIMRWWSPIERKFYNQVMELDSKKLQNLWEVQEDLGELNRYRYLVAGMSPYGGIAIWLRGYMKSVLIDWRKAEDVSLPEDVFIRLSKEYPAPQGVLLPTETTFDNNMRQYQYRYVGLEEYFDGKVWQQYDVEDEYYDDLDLDSIEDQRFDGTHDQQRDGGLMKYHKAGCPKRIAVRWHEGNHDFSAYYWLNKDVMPQAFCSFFQKNIEGRIEILLRIDTRANHYGIAMKGDFIQQPQALPADAYQLIVFRNGLELFRSENYAQEDGAWNW